MKINLRHPFPCTPDRYWQSYWDAAFEAEVRKVTNIARDTLSDTTEGGIRTRRQRITSSMKLPPAAVKLMGTDQLSYEQTSRIDQAKGVLTWEIHPPVLQTQLKASGVMRVEATPDGCVQILEGDVTCSIFMVGKQLESTIVDVLTKAQDGTAEMRRKWLVANPA